jgi:TATA-box binding protein (TBP) (component of TFIID and TFIIIB)
VRKFIREVSGVGIPNRNTVQNLVNKGRTTDVLTDREKSQIRILKEGKLDSTGAQLEHSLSKSLKHLAQEIGESKVSQETLQCC